MISTILIAAILGLPAANPWVSQSAYAISHHNSAQTDSTPVDGPRVSKKLIVDDAQSVTALGCSAPTFKHIGKEAVVTERNPL